MNARIRVISYLLLIAFLSPARSAMSQHQNEIPPREDFGATSTTGQVGGNDAPQPPKNRKNGPPPG
jgi:hypothetical protein